MSALPPKADMSRISLSRSEVRNLTVPAQAPHTADVFHCVFCVTAWSSSTMRDVLGWRRKFGVIGPSTNTIVQPDFEMMRPVGVTNRYSRISRRTRKQSATRPSWRASRSSATTSWTLYAAL
jgi:hypothetical protein